MQRIAKKKKSQSGLPFVTLLVTLSIFFAVIILLDSNLKIYNKRAELREYIEEKEEELMILHERAGQDGTLATAEAEDDFMVEKIAREQLLLKKPGEEVVFITFPKSLSENEEEEEKPAVWWNPLTWKMWQ